MSLVQLQAFCVLGSVLISIATTALAQTTSGETADPSKTPSFERQVIDQAIKDLQVYMGDNRDMPLKANVVMRWPNNIRGTADGVTVIWTDQGRPRVACCIYTWQGKELHWGFGSLSTAPVSAVLNGESVWHPTSPGLEFKPVPDTPEPGNSARVRLRQMRSMSQRFSSQYHEDDTLVEELRRIPNPVYRYEVPAPVGELVDGAVFAFAQGTDPESFLLLEARRIETATRWYYATAKRTVGRVVIELDGKPVQVHPWGGWNTFEPLAIFTTLKRPLPRDE